jgi:hypothetical protein
MKTVTNKEYLEVARKIVDGNLPIKTSAISSGQWSKAQEIIGKTLGASNETYIHPTLLYGLCEHIAEALSGEQLEPAFLSIENAARYTSESTWTIEDLLRRGVLKAKKSGRRTLVEVASIKERAESLPIATFKPPRGHQRG